MTLKALIFDVDGTLAETEELHRRAFNETFADAGMDWYWTTEDYRELLKTTGGKERMRRHRVDIRAEGPSDTEIAQLHLRKTARYADLTNQGHVALRGGVPELIADARKKGLKVAVATTTNRPNVDALCQACWGQPAEKVFDVIAAGDEVKSKKPAPDVYLLALEQLGLRAEECVAFEDSFNGLTSARAARIQCVITPSIYTEHERFDGAAMVLRDLKNFSLSELFETIEA